MNQAATRWVTSSVVARVLGVSVRTVQRYCVPGKCLFIHTRFTPGGHLRINLEEARRLREQFERISDSHLGDI